jgi:hypothetical protein
VLDFVNAYLTDSAFANVEQTAPLRAACPYPGRSSPHPPYNPSILIAERAKSTRFTASLDCPSPDRAEVAPRPAPTPVPTGTAIPPPTLTPTPSTPLAILVVPADMDQVTSDLYQRTVYDLASAWLSLGPQWADRG